jgi:hypothetical protein
MSNQVGDCFKFLWHFQNVRTLGRTGLRNTAGSGFKVDTLQRMSKLVILSFFLVKSISVSSSSVQCSGTVEAVKHYCYAKCMNEMLQKPLSCHQLFIVDGA